MTVTPQLTLPTVIQDGVTLLEASSVMPNFTALRDAQNTHTHTEFTSALALAPTTDARNQIVGDIAARLVLSSKVPTDTQNRLQIGADGKIAWGPGGSTAPDTNLYRSAAGTLQTDGLFWVNSDQGVLTLGTAVAANVLRVRVSGDTQNRLLITADGKMSWGPGGATAPDTSLYRAGAAYLQTDGLIVGKQTNTGNYCFGAWITGDTQYRWLCRSDGFMAWGPGGAPQDTFLQRIGAATLQVTTYLTAIYDITARPGVAAYQTLIGNAGYGAGIGMGSPLDTYLYRGGANYVNCYNGAWGTLSAAAFTVSSDRSLKSEIEQHDVPVEKLLKAGIYTYQLNKTEGRHLGLMSEELPDEVVSMIGDPEGGDDLRFVDIYKLTTALLATVQHLNERLVAGKL